MQHNNKIGTYFIACMAALPILLMPTARSQAQSETPLSAMDYIEIQQLVNTLNFALDYCTNGGNDFADLFIDGGAYIIDQGDGMPSVRSTREELIALAGGPGCESRSSAPTSYILHLSESLVISPDANGAHGISYAIYPANKGNTLNEETVGQVGIYHDDYVKTSEGWRFRSRRHELNPVSDDLKL